MAKSYLDKDGLLYFWQKLKNTFALRTDAIKNITRSGTTFTATKADGTTFTFTQQDSNTWNANSKDVAGYVAAPTSSNANKVWKTDSAGAPAWRDDADTTYSDATTSTHGLMSTDDKTKLDGIATGAEVNQNAFSAVKVGTTSVEADGKTDTLELVAGSNVTLTPDATNDKVTIAAKDTTYSDATTTAHGLMTAADKTKLNGVEAGAEKNTITSVAGKTGAVTLAKGDVGLGNVDNTADADKSVKSAGTLTTARNIDGVDFDGSADIVHYGVCSTAAGTAAKVVACTGFKLVEGASILVKFSNANTGAVGSLTLNVNGTGAKSIKRYGTTNLAAAGNIKAGQIIQFVYDGTNWLWVGDIDTNSTYTAAAATPKMDGTAAVGTSAKYAREDHIHPSDTSRVPTTRRVNGKALSSDIDILAEDIEISETATGAIQYALDLVSNDVDDALANIALYMLSTSWLGVANGVCPLNASRKIDSTYLPSYVDDVIEVYARSGQTALSENWLATGSATGTVVTPETGKIYVLMADSGDYAANTQFRWSSTAYVKLADGGVSSITNAEIDTIMAS